MISDLERERLLARRAFIWGGVQAAGLFVLAGQLFRLQVVEGEKYRTLAEENRIATRLIVPPRGLVLARDGAVMAQNTQNFQALLLPEQTDDVQQFITNFTRHVPLPDADQKRITRDLRRRAAFAPILLHDHLTWEQVARLELHVPDLPGLQIEVGEVRFYPFGTATAHVLGYVGPPTEREAAQSQEQIYKQPGFRLGKNGLERHYERTLRGTAGSKQLEVNAHGRIVRELANTPAQNGSALKTMLDLNLQRMMQERLALEQSAAAVVLDVHTGAVHGLASHPTFDPNLFTFGIPQTTWTQLNEDERAPLTNKVVSGQYAPGSTFKMITALAALEAGVIDETTTVTCPGFMELGNHRFHCWKHEGHGPLRCVDAIAESCDVYFYDVARRVGIDKIQQMAERLGLGAKLNIDVPHERAGLVPSRAWKQAKLRAPWQQGETLIAAIGQGYVLATPLQLAIMTARLVNGGKQVLPHVADLPREQTNWGNLGIKPKNLQLMIDAMNAVTNANNGTAYGARIKEAGREMGGKTGTSQVRRISRAERATGIIPNEERPWRLRDHALFVGYAPIIQPKFAIAVVVEHGGGGSKVAAPIARDILLAAQQIIV